jgi:tetratricopeptide (TPR) repeat protein
MRKQAWLVGIVFLALSWQVQGQSWRDKYNQAEARYSEGNYEQALALGTEALNGYLAEGAPQQGTQAAILRLLSTISYALQAFDKGLEFASRELQLRETKKDTVYAVALVNRALFEEQLGHYDKAIESLTAARTVFIGAYPKDHESVLACDVGLGTNYYLLSDYARARQWLNPALEAIEKKGAFSEEFLEGYYYAGMVEVESMHGESALTKFMKAAEIFASASLTESETYALTLYGRGLSYQLLHHYEAAEKSLHEAQQVYEKIIGKTGQEYEAILSARILNAHYLGKPDQAADWLKQLLVLPSGKRSFADAAASLGSFYHGRGDLKKADGYYRESLQAYNAKVEDDLRKQTSACRRFVPTREIPRSRCSGSRRAWASLRSLKASKVSCTLLR